MIVASSAARHAAGMTILRVLTFVKCYIFVHFSSAPFRPWIWLYPQKASETYIPMIYCPYGNILNFLHESDTFLGEQYVIPPIQTNGAQMQKMPETMPETAPSPWGTWTPIWHINAWAVGPPHSPPQTASGSNQPFHHNTLCGQTDRWSKRIFRTMSALARYADRKRRANNAA